MEFKPFCIALPVLPGKREMAKEFARIATIDRRRELEASERRLGIEKECLFLQQTPQGDLFLVYFEAADPMRASQQFGASKDSFDQWFKDQVKAITGVDLSQPPPGPLPEAIGTYGY